MKPKVDKGVKSLQEVIMTVERKEIGYIISRLGLMLILLVFSQSIKAQFAGGDGTQESPWQIANANHLDNIREYLGEEHNDKYFLQTADINLGEEEWIEDGGWVPLGTSSENSFRGYYDGGEFLIDNMTISRGAMNQSLFGYLHSATVRRVGLRNVSIRSGGRAAGIAGTIEGETVVEKCFVTGNIDGNHQSGGIVGVGTDRGSIVRDCYSMADMAILISMERNPILGGIVGSLDNGTVSRCYAIGSIMPASSERAAAVVGVRIDGMISDIYWNSETTGTEHGVGREDDFPGNTTAQMLLQETYQNFNFETIWGIEDQISYPYLSWQGGPDVVNICGPRNLTGIGENTVLNLIWQEPVSGIAPLGYNVYMNDRLLNDEPVENTQYRITGLQNWEYNDYYVTAVFEVAESSPSNIYKGSAVHFADGTGSEDDPYQVATPEHLYGVSFALSHHFLQVDDINLGVPPYNQGEGWEPIGTHSGEMRFRGTYNGNGFVISNLMIRRDENYQGLFAYTEDALLRNIALEDVSITAAMYIGGLTAFQHNTRIENCSISGTVSSTLQVSSYTGGLVGQSRFGDNESNAIVNSVSTADVTGATFTGGIVGYMWIGDIVGCKTSGDISGRSSVGGIAGYARNRIIESYSSANVTGTATYTGGLAGTGAGDTVIRDSYARGNVHGHNHAGGLIGRNVGDIINCYSTARVTGEDNLGGLIGSNTGNVQNSYWDIEASNQGESDGGLGRFSRQMIYPYDHQTYTDWDFEDVWVHDITREFNNGYPYLRHFLVEGPDPQIAANPIPLNNAVNIPADLDSLKWEYHPHPAFANPVGFRVYINDSNDFQNVEPNWVEYQAERVNYSIPLSELIDELLYVTTYYWKVVPTTDVPNDRRGNNRKSDPNGKSLQRDGRLIFPATRGDAQNVPVWRFTTEIHPYPVIATNPHPSDNAENVHLYLEQLRWTYTRNDNYTNPVGFRVYFNKTGEFEPDDDYSWTRFYLHQTDYNNSAILPNQLEPNTTYYWKVVPTTINPDDNGRAGSLVEQKKRGSTGQAVSCQYEDRRRRSERDGRLTFPATRGDAQDVPVWSFSTIVTDAEDVTVQPLETTLYQNYPNPFNPYTKIPFSLAEQGNVLIEIFNTRGQKVAYLQGENLRAGENTILWDGSDSRGNSLSSGIYLYRMISGNYSETRKMIMLR